MPRMRLQNGRATGWRRVLITLPVADVSLVLFDIVYCMLFLLRASLFVLCVFCVFSLVCFQFGSQFTLLTYLLIYSAPVQVISWKDPCPKWAVVLSGMQNYLLVNSVNPFFMLKLGHVPRDVLLGALLMFADLLWCDSWRRTTSKESVIRWTWWWSVVITELVNVPVAMVDSCSPATMMSMKSIRQSARSFTVLY